MIFVFKSPDRVPLEAVAQGLDGAGKTNVVGGDVRVYRIGSGGEEELLATTALALVPGTTRWRYSWESPPLVTYGMCTAEYRLLDSDGLVGVASEDILVVSEEKLDTLLDVDLGRTTLDAVNNTWTIYRRDGTVLRVFDVKDDLGNPGVEDVFDRLPR